VVERNLKRVSDELVKARRCERKRALSIPQVRQLILPFLSETID
jgi:hypothetical protein